MNIVSNFLESLATVIVIALDLYMYLVVARAILSWVSPDPYNPIVRFIHNATEPVLYRIRSWIPSIVGGIDFSPVIVILIIIFLRTFIGKTFL